MYTYISCWRLSIIKFVDTGALRLAPLPGEFDEPIDPGAVMSCSHAHVCMYIYIYNHIYLVGGLEHFLFSIIYGIILPIY